MTVQQVPTDYPIAAMGGCRGDLSGIVIEKFNVRVVHVWSEEFIQFLRTLSNENSWESKFETIKDAANKHRSSGQDIDHDEWQMLIPIDLEKPLDEHILHELVLAITTAFPSSAYLRTVYHLQYIEGEIHDGMTSYFDKQYRFYPQKIEQDHFTVDGINIEELNEFTSQFLDYLSKDTQLSRAIQFYQSSYQINDDLMSYVALIIVLEVIVPGKEQVFFRLRRSIGILLGRNRAEAERLIKNLEFLYGFRSSIVHGTQINVKEEIFETYYRYARDTAARLIIEIVSHGFENVDSLAYEINLSGIAHFTKKEGYKNYFAGNEYWENFYLLQLTKLK